MESMKLSNPVIDPTYSLAEMVADMKQVADRIICGKSLHVEREWFEWAKGKLEAWAENWEVCLNGYLLVPCRAHSST